MVNDQADSCSHQVSLGGFVSRVELKGVNGHGCFDWPKVIRVISLLQQALGPTPGVFGSNPSSGSGQRPHLVHTW